MLQLALLGVVLLGFGLLARSICRRRAGPVHDGVAAALCIAAALLAYRYRGASLRLFAPPLAIAAGHRCVRRGLSWRRG